MAAMTYEEFLARGRAHQGEGRAVDAMLCFRQAARLAPRATDPRFHLGEVLWQLGLLPEAIAAWREACAVGPGHAAPHYALAEALLAVGDAAGARDIAGRVLTLAPDNPRRSTIHATARLILAEGTSSDARAERAAAAEVIAEALAREPALRAVPSIAGPLAVALDRLPEGEERDGLFDSIVAVAAGDAAAIPALLLALACERLPPGADSDALFAQALRRGYGASDHDARGRTRGAPRP